MFNNTIFTIKSVEKEEERHVAEVSFDPQHEIFRGHFPDKKVVPGVMLMQTVKEIVQKILDLDNFMIVEAGMKFLNPVLVDESNTLTIGINLKEETNGSLKVKSIGVGNDKKYFKIDLLLKTV